MSKLFSTSQMRSWDQYTMSHEPVSSVQLMFRAAGKCVEWILLHWNSQDTKFLICCGRGNNGGDGWVIARLLSKLNYEVNVCAMELENDEPAIAPDAKGSDDGTRLSYFYFDKVRRVEKDTIIIDAVLGSGLSGRAHGTEADMIQWINQAGCTVVSIDVPSGLLSDLELTEGVVVRADYTLTFQQLKPAFLFPESGQYCGELHVLDIGLDPHFEISTPSDQWLINKSLVRKLYIKRNPFSHKGTFGHALLIAGSAGKMGACCLATKACLHTGAGLVTALVTEQLSTIVQSNVPEAMVMFNESFNEKSSLQQFQAIGIGCGLGQDNRAVELLDLVLKTSTIPLILDADALNIIAENQSLLQSISGGSLLTPHLKEFDRLFGKFSNSIDRLHCQQAMAKKLNCFILLKGKYTSIATPDGKIYFNTTGNAGMAKGGSGDVLTGMITALFAQYQNMETAALMGVYLHGLAGDLTLNKMAMETMLASDLIDHISDAYRNLLSGSN